MGAKVLPVLVLTAVGLTSNWMALRAIPPGQTATKSEAALGEYVQLLRRDIRSQVKQLMAANLKLSDTEATKFWPVYDRYAADLIKINDQRYALIREYADHWGIMTNDQALSLAKSSSALDEQLAQLRTTYLPTFNQVVPGIKVATFFQLDRRIQQLIDLQLASQLPLAQEQY